MTELANRPDLPPIEPDTIRVVDGRFTGSASFYRQESGRLVPVVIHFDVDSSRLRPLNPFLYNKPPDTTALGVKPPNEQFKTGDPRSGNIPVAVAKNVMRKPNHLYETDDGIVTALDTAKPGESSKWETRYYPKNCLEPNTWQEAMAILGII